MKFRKKPVVIEATQWFKNGDHPEDRVGEQIPDPAYAPEEGKTYTAIEGRVVGFYRNPDDDGQRPCEHCEKRMHDHGWIDTKEGGHIVCPGDWIITGVQGERYPCKPDIFDATYEAVLSPREEVDVEFEDGAVFIPSDGDVALPIADFFGTEPQGASLSGMLVLLSSPFSEQNPETGEVILRVNGGAVAVDREGYIRLTDA